MSFENNLKRAFRTDFNNNKPSDKDFDSIFNNITTELGYKPKFRVPLKKIIPLAEAALVALLIISIPYLGVQPHYSNIPATQYKDGSEDRVTVQFSSANPAKESTAQVTDKSESVTPIEKRYNIEYTNKRKSFTTDSVVVDKNNTIGKMTIILFMNTHYAFDEEPDYNAFKGNVHLKIYQDGKLIFEKTDIDPNYGFEVPYKITKEKSTFKIKLDYMKDLHLDHPLCAKFNWYVNEMP